ncbi:MAG: large-conductance mechanosensitive channel protein MscL [Desulfitobacteriaceae bacterium]|nr:large-conductance mechanosensitive channel protein MscL [Desulfitobacteriaceae bacterium]
MLDEFKKFALRGNVVDLAVGVIIGGAFGKIVTSLVNDLIMPVLGVITGNVNLAALKWTISQATEGTEELSINYGQFLQSMLDFILVAFSIFMIVKLINNIRKKEEEKPTLPPKPSNEELVLTEIRDILKSQK